MSGSKYAADSFALYSCVVSDDEGNAYLVSTSMNSATPSRRPVDIHIVKYNDTGTPLDTIVYDSGTEDLVKSAVIDADKNIHITGLTGIDPAQDVFVVKVRF